ncbi:hypothetical protein HanHA300_Chr01g0032811 [Helianthus annuus]|nr:hypothetical protein HanHA300_Chr01g0032811 [Helianthus annuus]KAJ0793853.1 hypothetical protein HanOQP8_Chr01g0033811 [Helianthus annuus]KAJ0958446.1 hypothetical protein HanPSC8_Chr01g0039071 [Helianthus annuus]
MQVDIPSSGLIYFDVGAISKQFSLSSFKSPRECLANSNRVVVQSIFKLAVSCLWRDQFSLKKMGMGLGVSRLSRVEVAVARFEPEVRRW